MAVPSTISSSRRAISLALASVPVVGIAGCSSSKVPDVVKIGVAVNQSGPAGPRGLDIARGAELAVEHINASGLFKIDGKSVRLELVSKDDKGDPASAKRVATELVAEGVRAVIGHMNTSETQAALPVYAEAGLPHLFTSTNKPLTQQGSGNTFRLVAHSGIQARAMQRFAMEQLATKRVVMVVEKGVWGESVHDDIIASSDKKFPVLARINVDVKDGLSDADAQVMVAAKPDLVVVIGRELQALSTIDRMVAADMKDVRLIGTNPTRTAKVAQSAQRIASMHAASDVIDVFEVTGGHDFLTTFRARYKSEPIWGAHYSYDAVYALLSAMRKAKSVEPARIVETLKSPTFEPNTRIVTGMRFTEQGEQKYPSIGIYASDGKRWEVTTRASNW